MGAIPWTGSGWNGGNPTEEERVAEKDVVNGRQP
jgi:hypothetical protein